MTDWEEKSKELPEDIHQFDWRNFQQEYRDYIDLAKMAQLVPIIGAPVGARSKLQDDKKIRVNSDECLSYEIVMNHLSNVISPLL